MQDGSGQIRGALPAEGVDEPGLPRPAVQISQREGGTPPQIPAGKWPQHPHPTPGG